MSGALSAVVPVKDLWGPKSRLKPILDGGARAGLTIYMMGRVIAALREAGLEEVCVVSPDRIVLDEAEKRGDRKSTRLNSSHANISYAVFCLKKKNSELSSVSHL